MREYEHTARNSEMYSNVFLLNTDNCKTWKSSVRAGIELHTVTFPASDFCQHNKKINDKWMKYLVGKLLGCLVGLRD